MERNQSNKKRERDKKESLSMRLLINAPKLKRRKKTLPEKAGKDHLQDCGYRVEKIHPGESI